MRIVLTALCGFALDLILGDPEVLTPFHSVVLMGRCITGLEKRLRMILPKNRRGEFIGGCITAVILPLGTLLVCIGLLMWLRRILPPAAFLLEVIWCWQALAVRNLRDEAMRVYDRLQSGDIDKARKAVSRIVGRDTENLDAAGVTCAAVETVAENFSDGIIAPMIYMLLGGAPLALCYKAVNTMDSMLGYKNERFLWFGKAAAHLDDAAGFVPARMAALLLVAAAALCRENAGDAFRIWRRDRRAHASPNAGQCEAAMAGALGVRLCGPATYFGKRVEKPYIGDSQREIEDTDIRRACRMEMAGSLTGLVLFCLLRTGILWMTGNL